MKKILPSLLAVALLLSCANDEKLFQAAVSEVKASSFVVESVLAYGRYHPLMALDNDPLTAWNEAAKGPGLGEWIEIAFDKPITADAIKLMPGYFDAQWYQKNNRIKSLEIALDGKTIQAELTDGMDEKTIKLEKETPFSKIRLTIKDVFKGSAYDDTCLAEIAFYLHKRKIEFNTDVPHMQMDREDGTAQIESLDSPMGKEISWYAMMGIGETQSFNPDHTYTAVPASIIRGDTTIIGKWNMDESGRIQLTNLYECSLVGKGSPHSEPGYGFDSYAAYDYVYKRIADRVWHSNSGLAVWKDFISRLKVNPGDENLRKTSGAEYELYKIKPDQRDEYILKRIMTMVESKPQETIDRLIQIYHSQDEFYKLHPDYPNELGK